MKLKTKRILAGFGMGITAVVGLSCVGLGLYAILTMKHPYINQWVDLAKEKFDPIVSQIDNEFIKKEIGHDPSETDVINFYFDKVSKTPEILVEDILDIKNNEVHPDGGNPYSKYQLRISDPTITKDDDNYFISFLLNESCKAKENNEIKNELSWKGSFTNFPISVSQDSNGGWNIKIAPDQSKQQGKATIEIDINTGSQDIGTYEITDGSVPSELTDRYFYDFEFSSRYLELVEIQ